MLHLCDVLQFVIYGFNNSPLPEKKLVGDTHQRTSHVAFQFCDKLYAIDKEPLEEILSDIAFVTDELSVNEFNKSLVLKRFAVIYVTWSYHEIQNLALLVANQVQFEAKEPSHGTFASLRNALEYFVDMYPLVPAHPQRSAVDKAYACTLAQQYLLYKQGQGDGNLFFKFHEAVVGDDLGEEVAKVLADFFCLHYSFTLFFSFFYCYNMVK